ncbi:glycosyltransferase family 4 protein [Labilibacter marinus]|uniref:glycosyltransferase family 4 protein n=1 Tax=Labilibacter marinus TaxID=1477105 RepID=UPI0009501E62|nr:glycosyltransferase family 4 protein [Labilibacter marinus]
MNSSEDKSICFVIPHFVTFSTGGAEIQIHYLTQSFIKRGWKVEVICAGLGLEQRMKASPFYNGAITYHYYKKRTIRFMEYWDVLKLLKLTNCNYYYQRTDFALTAATYSFAKRNRKKMVFALASDSDAERNKYSKAFKQFKYTGIVKKLVRKVDFKVLDKMIEWAKSGVKHVVFQNEYQAQTYLTNFNKKGVIIPNSFLPSNQESTTKENVILWCGNDSPVKRPQLFVDLAKQLSDFKDWTFVMIGSACNQINEKNISANLKVLGSVSYQEANNWFAKSKIYINTSEVEGMPNTFIQSWYYETLVCSLSVDPNACFSNENTGIFADDDLNEMYQVLKDIMQKGVNEQIITNGTKYFKMYFDLEQNTEKLINYITA